MVVAKSRFHSEWLQSSQRQTTVITATLDLFSMTRVLSIVSSFASFAQKYRLASSQFPKRRAGTIFVFPARGFTSVFIPTPVMSTTKMLWFSEMKEEPMFHGYNPQSCLVIDR